MKIIASLSFILGLSTFVFAQKEFAVEVGAYAEAVDLSYFKGLEDVYETLDVNYIYRYYIDVANEEEAKEMLAKVKAADFVHARIINFKELKEVCDIKCGYQPPKPTGKNMSNSTNRRDANKPVDNNDNDLTEDNSREYNERHTSVYAEGSPIYSYSNDSMLHAIFFDYGAADLSSAAKKELDKFFQVLSRNSTYKLRILAHTDSKGAVSFNDKLSLKRATTTKKYIEQQGINSNRITIKPFGERRPIAKNRDEKGRDLEEGRKFNRRIEFEVLDNSGKVLNIVKNITVPQQLKK